MFRATLVLLLCLQAELNFIGFAQSVQSMSRTSQNQKVHVDVNIHDPISKEASLVRSLKEREGSALMEVGDRGEIMQIQKGKNLIVRSRAFGDQPGQCTKAETAVATMNTGINDDVVPKLEAIHFTTTLNTDVNQTQRAKAAAVAAHLVANNESTNLDNCFTAEKEIQGEVATWTEKVGDAQEEKYTECNRAASLESYNFKMPDSASVMHRCNFSTSTVAHCFNSAYEALLDELDREVQAQDELYDASTNSCAEWVEYLSGNRSKLNTAEGNRDTKEGECNRVAGRKMQAYCDFSSKIGTLCEDSTDLLEVWDKLEAEKDTKRDAIRTMKVTQCLVTQHYTLGTSGCTGCELGSRAQALSACDAEFPETAAYGVPMDEPTMVTESKTFFDSLPGKCGDKGSDSVTFPGHLWTRDPSTKALTKGAVETTTFTAIDGSCR